jgi:hypothetical protein
LSYQLSAISYQPAAGTPMISCSQLTAQGSQLIAHSSQLKGESHD